ncbi:MAG: FkbM family methyltransferase [Cyanobacteriota bacterium]|nr:FkbM family methyltransferase [Cyanobacteriota bacterium]
MSLYPSVERIINKALAPFDIVIDRQSRCDSENQGHLLSRFADNAKLIGSHGACESFITFASLEESRKDQEIKDFMRFYAEFFRHSCSQWTQDVFVMYQTRMKRHGSYLEVGGADGLTHSNTLSLRDHLGWSGVLVEPDPDLSALLRASRGHTDQVIHAAISPDGSTGSALLRRAGQLSALVGHEGRDIHSEQRKHHEGTATVEMVDLTTVLKTQPRIDYFSLDVEGAELSILQSIRWREIIPPGLITVEHNFRPSEKEGIRRLLSENGYSEKYEGHDWLRRGDLWMVHQEYVP